jgi:FkbM family methyltransferase
MGASAVVTDVFEHLSKILTKHDVKPLGVLHVGGHHGEEQKAYVEAGFEKILWMEPIPELAAKLRDRGLDVVEAAAGTVPGEATFYSTERSYWSSLLKPKTRQHEEITVSVVRIDSLNHGCNVLVVDAQGSEPDVIESADLDSFDLAVIETGTQQQYEGQVFFEPVDEMMVAAGFELVGVYWHQHNMVIGDRVYVR